MSTVKKKGVTVFVQKCFSALSICKLQRPILSQYLNVARTKRLSTVSSHFHGQ
jgi:hypothetical protein